VSIGFLLTGGGTIHFHPSVSCHNEYKPILTQLTNFASR
jgi:hypothetical protein